MLAARVEQKNGTYVHNIQTGIQLRRTPPASPCSVSFRIAVHIVAPLARQIEPIGDRQARMMVGDRQCHRYLAIGLLAELPAVLMMHPDRMRAFLGKPSVVDDP